MRIPAPPAKPWELTLSEVDLVRNHIAKGATDTELQFCLAVARRYHLDPFRQQIWFVKRGDRSADGGYRWIPIVGINGLQHVAARDHADYGSVEEPEFGPMKTVQWKYYDKSGQLQAPEWARVRVWKKGAAQPTTGMVYWDEIYPEVGASPLVRQMPRLMLGKCARAQAIRQAYPATDGLYIREEFQGPPAFTPQGRRIVYPETETPHTGELDDHAAHGHLPGSDKAKQAEEQLRKVEAADKAALEARRATKSTTIDQPPSHAESPQKPSVDAREMAILTAEKTPQGDFVITGDVQASPELYAAVEKHFVWIKDFWHATEEDLRAMAQLQTQLKFTLKMPQTSGAKERREQPDSKTTNPAGGSAAGTTAEPEVVSGAIERTTSGMTHKNAPTRQVKIGGAWYSCFVNTIFEFLDKGVGKEAEVFLNKRKNIVGLKRVGKTQFDADGRTPVIQRKDQEAGGSLFGK